LLSIGSLAQIRMDVNKAVVKDQVIGFGAWLLVRIIHGIRSRIILGVAIVILFKARQNRALNENQLPI
jgi:hypothetical protein